MLPMPEYTHRAMGQRKKNYWKETETGSGFHLCSQISFFNELLRHKRYTRGYKLNCNYCRCTKWSACKKNNSTKLMVHRDNLSVGENTGAGWDLGKQQSMGTISSLFRQLLPCISPLLPNLPIFQDKLFWTNGNKASYKIQPFDCVWRWIKITESEERKQMSCLR